MAHADDIHDYEGPPCDYCRSIMFVGTCTHRPRKYPKFADIELTEEQKAAIRKIAEDALKANRKT